MYVIYHARVQLSRRINCDELMMSALRVDVFALVSLLSSMERTPGLPVVSSSQNISWFKSKIDQVILIFAFIVGGLQSIVHIVEEKDCKNS